MVEPELKQLMTFQVELRAPAASNTAGERTWADALTGVDGELPWCAVQNTVNYTSGDPGSAQNVQGSIYLDDTYPVGTDWYVGLPGNAPFSGQKVFIVKVEQLTDENGPYSTVLQVGAR